MKVLARLKEGGNMKFEDIIKQLEEDVNKRMEPEKEESIRLSFCCKIRKVIERLREGGITINAKTFYNKI